MPTETTLRNPADLADHPLLKGIPVWAAHEPEFQSLKESIRERGLDYPILVDSEGQVVDGRNRRNACAALGLEVLVREVPDDQIAEIIVSALGNRRHLSKKAMAYLLAPFLKPAVEAARARRDAIRKAGGTIVRGADYGQNGLTIEGLADQIGIGRSLFFQALKVHKLLAEHPEYRIEIEDDVLHGELTLGYAITTIQNGLRERPADLAKRAQHDRLFLGYLPKIAHQWSEASPAQRTAAAEKLATVVIGWPEDLRANLTQALRRAERASA